LVLQLRPRGTHPSGRHEMNRIHGRQRPASVAAALAAFELALLADTVPATAEPILATRPFEVTDVATRSGFRKGARPLSDGGFVIFWTDDETDDDLVRRYDSTGAAIGAAVTLPSTPRFEGVVPLPDPPFDALIMVDGSSDPLPQLVRLFDVSGAPLGIEFPLFDDPTVYRTVIGAASNANGKLLIVYRGLLPSGESGAVGRLFDVSTGPIGSEIPMFSGNTGIDVAMRDDGSFVVAAKRIGENLAIAARFAADGTALGPVFEVGSTGNYPTIAALSGGGFVVARELSDDILVRIYDDAGDPVGSEIAIAPEVGTTGCASSASGKYPGVLASPDGGFLVVWEGSAAEGGHTIQARAFDAAGTALGSRVTVSDELDLAAGRPSVAAQPDGTAMVTWSLPVYCPRQLLTDRRFARRFCLTSGYGCDVCPGHDDGQDADGDGVPDGCDYCTNVGNARVLGRTKLKIERADRDALEGKKRKLSLKTELVLGGSGQAFADLDPAANGALIRIESPSGTAVYDVLLSANEGGADEPWRSNRAGTKWLFRGDAGDLSHNGIRKFLIKDRSRKTPNLARVVIKGKGGRWVTNEAILPLTIRIAPGGYAASAEQNCGELTFTPEQCELKRESLVDCRQ
jgi:hypothetical protein